MIFKLNSYGFHLLLLIFSQSLSCFAAPSLVGACFVGVGNAPAGSSAAGCAPQERATEQPYQFSAKEESVDHAFLGTFSVPEQHAVEGSRQIELKYVRLPSTATDPGSPIVFLAGGPGGSGIETGRGSRFVVFNQLRALGDVILLDQRGTGNSHRLPVGAKWELPRNQVIDEDVLRQALADAWKQSEIEWLNREVDLTAYNTENNADDLEILRQALGARKLRLIGSSYGTHLALAFLRRHPDSAESAILAGVEGPDHTLKLPEHQSAMLKQVQAWIDADPETKQLYPDLSGSIRRLVATLEAEPVVVGEGDTKMVICALDVQRFLASLLRSRQTLAILPKQVKSMTEGNFFTIGFSLQRLRSGTMRAMPLAMDLASGASQQRLDTIATGRAESPLGDAINLPLSLLIPSAADLRLPDSFRSPLTSDIPVLAISGTADGRTPVANAIEVLSTLKNGQHLIIEAAGHGEELFVSSPQIARQMLLFFNGQPLETQRIALEPVRFAK